MLILGNQFVPFSKAIFEQLNPIETARDPKYSLVRATYRTITTMNKGLIDRKEPNTFSLISKLSENKKYNHHALGEHVKNMISLQKRLRRIESGNIQDRKKNPYDPIAHPSLFFRRKEELQDILTRNLSPKAVNSPIKTSLKLAQSLYQKECSIISARTNQSNNSLEFSLETTRRNPVEKTFSQTHINIADPPMIRRPRPKTSKPTGTTKRRQEVEKLFSIAKDNNKIVEANSGRDGNVGKDLYMKYLSGTPKGDGVYGKLKKTLVEKIVGGRVYQADQLQQLFEKTVRENPGLEPKRLKTIWAEIMNDLNA